MGRKTVQFWETKKFKKLSVVWEKKLKKSGFEDAEREHCGKVFLKQLAENAYGKTDKLERETRLEYYLLLSHLVDSAVFPNRLEELIMHKHADGFSITEIVNEAKKEKLPVFRHTVRYIIRRWHMRWGLKYWSLQKMNLRKPIE
jgi:hypothetical protein